VVAVGRRGHNQIIRWSEDETRGPAEEYSSKLGSSVCRKSDPQSRPSPTGNSRVPPLQLFSYRKVVQNQVTLPLPSRLHVALDTPHFEVVGNTFRVLLAAASECGAGEDLVKKIEGSLKTMMEMIEKRTEDEKNSNLVYRRETMEYVVNTVEVSTKRGVVELPVLTRHVFRSCRCRR
jgi:hypothetical protein